MPAAVDHFYQSVGFHFEVIFHGLGAERKGVDGRFQSVSGLEVSLETETVAEGAENRFDHVVPVRTKYSNLVLRRGLLSPGGVSLVTSWCKEAFDDFVFKPIALDVALLNEQHEPLMKWRFNHAWPVSWKIGELNAERSEVLIETLELRYNRFTFEEP